jgi:hypothetical protein
VLFKIHMIVFESFGMSFNAFFIEILERVVEW